MLISPQLSKATKGMMVVSYSFSDYTKFNGVKDQSHVAQIRAEPVTPQYNPGPKTKADRVLSFRASTLTRNQGLEKKKKQ